MFQEDGSFRSSNEEAHINIDSTSSSHRHALSASSFSFNSNYTTTSSSDEWLIDLGEYYHMAKDKAIFC